MPTYSFQMSAGLAGSSVSVTAAGSSTVVASGTLDSNALFTASLPVGDYVAKAAGGHYSYSSAGTVAQPDSDQLAELSATYGRPLGLVAVALGDSITNYSGGIGPQVDPATSAGTDSKGLHAWASVLLGHPFTFYNAGKAGDTTAQMLARFDTDVATYGPGIVFVLGGTNDGLQSVASTTTQANLSAIYTKARTLGATVVACTVPPNTSMTTAQIGEVLQTNRWIRDYCRANRGMILADIGAAVADPATTYKYLTGHSADGTHPNSVGALKMGRILANALRPFIPANDILGQANGDPTNFLANPLMVGSGTALPTSWSVAGGLPAGATVSYVPSTDGLACSWLQIAVPNAAATLNLQQNISLGAGLAVGDRPYFAVEFACDTLDPAPAANTQAARVLLQCYNGSSFTKKSYDLYWDSGYVNAPFPGSYGVFKTPAFTIPAGTTLIQPVIQISGGGNYRFRRAALRK